MHEYTLHYFADDGTEKTIRFSAPSCNGALDRALQIAPRHLTILRDENGEICRFDRSSRDAVWHVTPSLNGRELARR